MKKTYSRYTSIILFLIVFINPGMAALDVSINTTNVICYGDSSGTINISVSPAGSYLYSIDGGITYRNSGSFYVYAGVYNLVVSEKVGNDIISLYEKPGIEITEPVIGVTILSVLTVMPRCKGGSDGVIIINATGPTPPPLQYALNNGAFQLSKRFDQDVSAGHYTAKVQDANGCTKTKDITVGEPPKIIVNATVTSVHGALKGSIRITKVLNVNPPNDSVKFSIDGGVTWQKDSVFAGLVEGSYSILLRSRVYNCPSDTVIHVGKDLAWSDTIGTQIMCFGEKTGKINLSIADPGAILPIWYKIRGPVKDSVQISDMSYSFINLPAGRYIVIIQDNISTKFTGSIILHQPAPFSITASIMSPLCNANANSTGSIDVITTGGTQPYTYHWSNNATTENLNNIKAGTYKVTVTDKYLCKDSTKFTLNSINKVTADAGCDTSVCPQQTLTLDGSGTSLLTDDILSYKWTPASLVTDSLSPKPIIVPGKSVNKYFLTVKNMSGCIAVDSVTIHVWPTYGLHITLSLADSLLLDTIKMDNSYTIHPIAQPDTFISYLWTPNGYMSDATSRTPTATLHPNTIYKVTATTKNNCKESRSTGKLYPRLPVIEKFDTVWASGSNNRDIPSVFWKNSPASTDSSWSRDDDGLIRGAWSNMAGAYTALDTSSGMGLKKALAVSSNHSARFHSSGAIKGTAGQLDFYADLSAPNEKKMVSFYYINEDGLDSLEIFISTNGGKTFTRKGVQKVQQNWVLIKIDLGNIVTKNGVIRFKATADHGSSDIGMDEVKITGEQIIINSTTLTKSKESASVFPNPSKGVFKVQLNSSANRTHLKVFNLEGFAILDQLANIDEQGILTIDISGEQSGIYLLQILTNKEPPQWVKLIKE